MSNANTATYTTEHLVVAGIEYTVTLCYYPDFTGIDAYLGELCNLESNLGELLIDSETGNWHGWYRGTKFVAASKSDLLRTLVKRLVMCGYMNHMQMPTWASRANHAEWGIEPR